MNIESYLPESGFNTNECVKSRIANVDIFAIPSASMYMFFDGMETSLIAKKENSIIKYQISEKIDINNLFLPSHLIRYEYHAKDFRHPRI